MVDIDSLILDTGLSGLERQGRKWNARCIVCGDSKKSRHKKRFWVLPPKGNLAHRCYCFNCGYDESFRFFLKTHFPDIHKRYFKSKFRAGMRRIDVSKESVEKTKCINVTKSEILSKRVCEFPTDHASHRFFHERKLPKIWKKYLLYTDNFREWINSKIPGKFDSVSDSDARIVIPFFTVDRRLFAVAGRALDKAARPRYITIKFDEDHPKIFGLERADFSRRVYVFEGQLDSLFIPNSLAMGGSISNVKKLLEYAPADRYVVVPDNEPRNPDVCRFAEDALGMGFSVSLMPASMKRHGKDVNDVVVNAGLTMREMRGIIDKEVVSGPRGRIKLKLWKRIS